MSNCYICKGKFGLKKYKRILTSGKKQLIVDVCSKICQTKKLARWGGD